jgi:hypothetical protein
VKLFNKKKQRELHLEAPSRASALRAPLQGAGLRNGAHVQLGTLQRQHLAAVIAWLAAQPPGLVELERPARHDGEDLLEEREEGALHVVARERGRLGEEEPLVLRQARGLVGLHLPAPRRHVGLVPDERHDGGAVGVRAELLHPPRHVVERRAPGDVVHHHGAQRAAVVGARHCPVPASLIRVKYSFWMVVTGRKSNRARAGQKQ